MIRERCPCCRAVLPAVKMCPGCGEPFYRSDGGRTDTVHCSARCGTRVRMRRLRERVQREGGSGG